MNKKSVRKSPREHSPFPPKGQVGETADAHKIGLFLIFVNLFLYIIYNIYFGFSLDYLHIQLVFQKVLNV